jgi:KipI family sensor histidine kinase inhibitor
MPAFHVHSYGSNDWLITLDDTSLIPVLHQTLSSSPIISETIIGYDSLLIRGAPMCDKLQLVELITQALKTHSNDSITPPRHHNIEVCYDGPDLEEVATTIGTDTEEVIHLHSSGLYTVRFLGFSPGFAYLDGLPTQLHLPRRSTPRTKMAAGAVAIGASHAGIYSIPSPGGWNWLGNTNHPLFDKNKNDASAFTLQPGDTVRFHPIGS